MEMQFEVTREWSIDFLHIHSLRVLFLTEKEDLSGLYNVENLYPMELSTTYWKEAEIIGSYFFVHTFSVITMLYIWIDKIWDKYFSFISRCDLLFIKLNILETRFLIFAIFTCQTGRHFLFFKYIIVILVHFK